MSTPPTLPPPPPRRGFAVYRPQTLIRGAVSSAADIVKRRLLEGDPDWTEFKRRWAEEFVDDASAADFLASRRQPNSKPPAQRGK